tara:strand:+ start:40 stop:258 length:219 start_codon:yes stop_codon:yes gene_type:complete
MSTESFNRTSAVETRPPQALVVSRSSNLNPKRANIDVLKQRLLDEKKKEKTKRTIIVSSVLVSLGALTILTY